MGFAAATISMRACEATFWPAGSRRQVVLEACIFQRGHVQPKTVSGAITFPCHLARTPYGPAMRLMHWIDARYCHLALLILIEQDIVLTQYQRARCACSFLRHGLQLALRAPSVQRLAPVTIFAARRDSTPHGRLRAWLCLSELLCGTVLLAYFA